MNEIEQHIHELHVNKGKRFGGTLYISDFFMSPNGHSNNRNGSVIAQRIESDLAFDKICKVVSERNRGEVIES